MLKKFLSSSVQKQIVGVSLTPGVGLEVVVYDRGKNVVVNYARRKVDYNFSTREIQDYVEFKSALSDMVTQMDIAPKSLAYLVLPNIYFDFMEVPDTITDVEIRTALLSKAEEFYLFKKEEPASGWAEVVNPNGRDQKRVVCSSIQRKAIDELKEIFSDIGMQLVGVEGAYSATLRGLYISGQLDDIILEHATWAAMVVNTNSFTLFYFDSKNLLDCTEVPIAIKSFSPEEAYSAIASSASQLLGNFSPSRLYIISQTDDIGAEVLRGQMQFDREVVTIDSNKYSTQPIVEVLQADDFAKANALTLGVIGASNVKTDFGLVLNSMQDDPEANLGVYFTTNIGGVVVDVTSEFVMKMFVMILSAVLFVYGVLALALWGLDRAAQNLLSKINNEIATIEKTIGSEGNNENKQEVDMNAVIDDIAGMNVEAIKYYDSIASDIPKNVWLTLYYNKDGDRIIIRGIAENIADIYEYYKNLKAIVPQSDIKLNELRALAEGSKDKDKQELMKSLLIDSDKDRLYSFEISNAAIGPEVNFGFDAPKKENQDGGPNNDDNGPKYDENDIIINGVSVEELSRQVQPTDEEE